MVDCAIFKPMNLVATNSTFLILFKKLRPKFKGKKSRFKICVVYNV